MTLDEKIAQLIQLVPHFYEGSNDKSDITGPMTELGISEEIVQNSGSVIGASGAKEIIQYPGYTSKEQSARYSIIIYG